MQRPIVIQVDLAKNEEYFVRVKAGNGEKEMFTETYSGRTPGESRRAALKAAQRIAGRMAVPVRVEVWDEATNEFRVSFAS